MEAEPKTVDANAGVGPGPSPPGSSKAPELVRLRTALRKAKKRLKRLEQENRTLREELLSAGEMIEDLAADLERPV